jgi:4-hydroxybenzoate polyprenyltransferase
MEDLNFEKILSYRPHICLLVFLLVLASGGSFSDIQKELFFSAMGFSFLMAFVYLFNKWTDIDEDQINVKGGPIDPAKKNRVLYGSLLFLTCPLFFLYHNRYLLLIYFIVAGIGLLYSYKVAIFGRPFRFKDKFLVKNLSSAVMWASPPAFVPAALRGAVWPLDIVSFIVVFFIVVPIEIVWDVRDIEGDKRFGIKTIPNVLGIQWTKIICIALFCIPGFFMLKFSFFKSSLIALSISIALILMIKESRGPMFYHNLVFLWCGTTIIRLVFDV